MSTLIQQQQLIGGLQFGNAGLQINMSDPAFIRRVNEAEQMARVAVKTGVTKEDAPFGMPEGVWNFFSTTADLMSRWNFGVAGFIDTVQGTGREGENPFERFGREVFSGAFGLKGDKETFGDVLDQAGVGDISISTLLTGQDRDWIFDPGLRGITGFGLDVVTDPLTWVSSPAGMLGRGMKVVTGEGLAKTLNPRGMKLFGEALEGEIEAARKFYGLPKKTGRNAILRRIAKDEEYFDAVVNDGFGKQTKLKGLNTIDETDVGGMGALQVEDRLAELAGKKIYDEFGEAVIEKEGLRFMPFRIGKFDPLGVNLPVGVDQVMARAYNSTMELIEKGVNRLFPDNGFVASVKSKHGKTLDFMNDIFFANSRLSRKDPYYAARESRRRTLLNSAKTRADQYSKKLFLGLKNLDLSPEDQKIFTSFLAEDVEGTLMSVKEVRKTMIAQEAFLNRAREVVEASAETDYPISFSQAKSMVARDIPLFQELGLADDMRNLDLYLERASFFNRNYRKFKDIKNALSNNHKEFKSEMNYMQMKRRIQRAMGSVGSTEVRAGFLKDDVVTEGGRYWPRDHSLFSEDELRQIYQNVRDPKLVKSNVGTYYEDRRAFSHWGFVKGMEDAGFAHRIEWDPEAVFANRLKVHYTQMINRDFVEDLVIRYGAKSDLMNDSAILKLMQDTSRAKASGKFNPEDITIADSVLQTLGNNDFRAMRDIIMENLHEASRIDEVAIERAIENATSLILGGENVSTETLQATKRVVSGNIRLAMKESLDAHREMSRWIVNNDLLQFEPGTLMDTVRAATPGRMKALFDDFNEVQLLLRLVEHDDPTKILKTIGNPKVKKGPITRSIIERAEMFARREGTLEIDPGKARKPKAATKPKPVPKAEPKAEIKPLPDEFKPGEGDLRQLDEVDEATVALTAEVKMIKQDLERRNATGGDWLGAAGAWRERMMKQGWSREKLNDIWQGSYDDVPVGSRPEPKLTTKGIDNKQKFEAEQFEKKFASKPAPETYDEAVEQMVDEAPLNRRVGRELEGGFNTGLGYVTFEQLDRAINEVFAEVSKGTVAEARDLTRIVLGVYKVMKETPDLRGVNQEVRDRAFYTAFKEVFGAKNVDALTSPGQQRWLDSLLAEPPESFEEFMAAVLTSKNTGIWGLNKQMDRLFTGNEELLDAFMKGDLPQESLKSAMVTVSRILKNASSPETDSGAFNLMVDVARLQSRMAQHVNDLMGVRLRQSHADAIEKILSDLDTMAMNQRIKSGRDFNELNAVVKRATYGGKGIYDNIKSMEFQRTFSKLTKEQKDLVVSGIVKEVNTFEDAGAIYNWLHGMEYFGDVEIEDALKPMRSVTGFTGGEESGRVLTLQTSQGKLHLDLPKHIADDVERVLTTRMIDPELSKFLKFVVWGNNVFKANVTRYFPSFNTRNVGSNFVQSIADAGFAILNPRLWRAAYHIIRGDVDMTMRLKNGMPLHEVARTIDAAGLITDPNAWTEVSRGGLNLPTDMPKWLLDQVSKWTRGRRSQVITDRLGTLHGLPSFAESHARILHYLALVEGGMPAQQALEHVNRFLFDYSALTHAEKLVFKNVFPFYTWTRKNIELQFRLMKEKPFVPSIQSKLFADTDRDDSAVLPDYLRGEMPVRFFSRDRKTQFLGGLDIPLRNMSAVWAGGVGATFKEHIGMMTPLIKTPVEFFYGKDTFGEDTRGHGRIRERLGAAIDRRYPKKMKEWLRFQVQTMPDGRKQYFADRAMLYMLNKGLFMSRWSNESLRIEEMATEFGGGNTEKGVVKLTQFLTGLSYREFDFTEAQKRAVYNNSARLQKMFDDLGLMRQFTTRYWSPEAKAATVQQGAL